MRKLVTFDCFGLMPVPWSVPEIGVAHRGGKRIRFTKRSKKSQLHLGRANLDDWQKFVAESAREAMASVPIPTGPVKLHIEFFVKTPPGKRHGSLWEVPITWNEEAGEFTKSQPRGKPEPDLVNLIKGTEDALQGVCVENDVQTRMMSSITFYGPLDGCRVHIHLIEPTDFPGYGETV